MKKRSFKVSSGGFCASATYFLERECARREPLGEIFDKINNIHSHSEHEIFYILDGEMELVREGGSARYSDAVVTVPAGMNHYTVVNSENIFVVYFSAENEETANMFSERLKDVFACSVTAEERFYTESLGRDHGEEDCQHILSLMFSAFIRRLAPGATVVKESPAEVGKYTFDIDFFIDNKYTEAVRLSELARYLHLCEKQVSRVIKREYNCSFSDLVKRKRLSVAAMMLKHTDMTVHIIARKIGFDNENYFYRVFKDEYGETPTEYRRSNQKNGS